MHQSHFPKHERVFFADDAENTFLLMQNRKNRTISEQSDINIFNLRKHGEKEKNHEVPSFLYYVLTQKIEPEGNFHNVLTQKFETKHFSQKSPRKKTRKRGEAWLLPYLYANIQNKIAESKKC